MKIRPLGQSGYELISGDSRILIDPYFSDSVNRLHSRPRLLPIPMTPEEMPCDAVFCTHNHLDHLDPETVLLFPEKQQFYTTQDGCQALCRLGRTSCAPILPEQMVVVGEFSVTAVPAFHSCDAIGLIVKAEGITLYFSGDTLYNEALFEIAEFQPDFTFICINGRLGNMTCDEALITAKAIGAKVNIPSYEVRKGDVIALKETSRKLEKFKVLIENITARTVPSWMDVDKENIVATIKELPKREDVDFPFEEHLIVELYSK